MASSSSSRFSSAPFTFSFPFASPSPSSSSLPNPTSTKNNRTENNIINLLQSRRYGKKIPVNNFLTSQTLTNINQKFRNISTSVENLKVAMFRNDWERMGQAMDALVTKLLDLPTQAEITSMGSSKINPQRKEEREIFVLIGGMNLLLQFLGPLVNQIDARMINTHQIQRHINLWNEVLVLLRELCYSIPNLSNQMFNDDQITFLFTLSAHDSLFESTLNLLEEILAVKLESYCLNNISNFYSLVDNFSTRRLAQFCRVLALVLFEPEDRVIMENSHILRSYELLLLRRDRMTKFSAVEIEKNQCLIIEMPGLLKKLVSLLRLTNYGPSISDLFENNFPIPNEFTADLMMHLSPLRSRNEWTYLESLEKVICQSCSSSSSSSSSSATAASSSSVSYTPGESTAIRSRNNRNYSNPPRTSLDTWLDGFDEFSLFSPGDDLDDPSPPLPSASSNSNRNSANNNRSNPAREMENSLRDLMRVMRTGNHTPEQALDELKFQALALAPHQVELLFVFCTLLSGRRKIEVQTRFAEFGLGNILFKMFDRLSWESLPDHISISSDHPHGPNCECNPLNALRVQYLRLIHNFFDRDFHNNSNKTCVLSTLENKIILKYQQNYLYQHYLLSLLSTTATTMTQPSSSSSSSSSSLSALGTTLLQSLPPLDMDQALNQIPPEQFGTLRSIMRILKREKSDSMYRFWLTSCLESFIRGLGYSEQMFVSSSDILSHLVQHICSDYNFDSSPPTAPPPASATSTSVAPSAAPFSSSSSSSPPSPSPQPSPSPSIQSILSTSTLQSTYDFLGEVIKFNFTIITKLEEILLKENLMNDFFAILSKHLIDSNVFLRALFVTFDSYNEKYQHFISQSRLMEWNLMPKKFFYLPPSCPHRHVRYEALSTGISGENAVNEEVGDGVKSMAAVDIITDPSQIDHPVATVGYLSHTWIHFQPEIISSEASFLLQQYQTEGKSSKKSSSSSSSSSSQSRSHPHPHAHSHSHSHAHLHSHSRHSSKRAVSTNPKNSNKKPLINSEKKISSNSAETLQPKSHQYLNDAITTFRNLFRSSSPSRENTNQEDSFENDRSPNERMEFNLRVERETHLKDCVDSVHESNSAEEAMETVLESERLVNDCQNDLNQNESVASGVFEWSLPPTVKYLSSYLEQQIEHILYGLMTIVTLRSINHENICCVNTALLIFNYAHKRKHIPQLLKGVRYLSKTQSNNLPNGQEDNCVIINFREVLWYWTEYYTRRGRDRLSLEFSTHVPFSQWKYIVDLLCRDDGSPCALLSSPIPLPVSPYANISQNELKEEKFVPSL